jgi:hypothetical protein
VHYSVRARKRRRKSRNATKKVALALLLWLRHYFFSLSLASNIIIEQYWARIPLFDTHYMTADCWLNGFICFPFFALQQQQQQHYQQQQTSSSLNKWQRQRAVLSERKEEEENFSSENVRRCENFRVKNYFHRCRDEFSFFEFAREKENLISVSVKTNIWDKNGQILKRGENFPRIIN